MAGEENFVHLGLFPFCIGEKNPASEDARYNEIIFEEFGQVGVGTIYPVGMSLADAMTLYWKSSGISWNLFQSIISQCFEFDEEGNIVPTGDSSVYEDYGSNYFPLANINQEAKDLSFKSRMCPEFTHRFTGSITAFRDNCPPDPIPPDWINPQITTSSFYPMSCFFIPLDFGPDPNLRIPYRILKSGDLYYPSLLLAFITYSRLYATKIFRTPETGWSIGGYKNIELIINGNSYNIPLLQALNYTRDGVYDTQISGSIYLDTWTA